MQKEHRPRSIQPSVEFEKRFSELLREAKIEIIKQVEERVGNKIEDTVKKHKEGPYKSVFYGIIAGLIVSFMWTVMMDGVQAHSNLNQPKKEDKLYVEKAIVR